MTILTTLPTATDGAQEVRQPQTKPKPYLAGSFQISLHTRLAQNLFKGSWRFGQMGLRQFAKTANILWKAYKEDDPYAEWCLLKIFENIEDAKTNLKQYEILLDKQMNSLRGLKIDIFTNMTPLEDTFAITTPSVFMAAILLENIDYVSRQLFTLTRLGLLAQDSLTPQDLYREAQKVFSLPREWHYTGVTRKDIRENNQKARKAYRLMKREVPLEILNKEIQFSFLPKVKRNENDAPVKE